MHIARGIRRRPGATGIICSQSGQLMTTLARRIFEGDRQAVEEAEARIREAATAEGTHEIRKALVHHYTKGAGARRGKDSGTAHLERDYEAALVHMRILYSEASQDPVYIFKLAYLLIDTGRHDEAMALLEPLRAADAPDVNVLAAMARVLYMQGAFGAAIGMLEETLALGLKTFGPAPGREQGRFLGSVLARLSRAHINEGDYARAAQVVEAFPQAVEAPFLDRTLRRARTLSSDGLPSQRPEARPVDLDQLTVACVKHGTKYGPDYVNRLYAMVRRHLPGNWRFVCFTEDPEGLRPEVDVIDISGIRIRGWWTKLVLFDPRSQIVDQTVFYLDLDTVVVGDLSFIEGLKVGFHILEHPDAPSFNSSVMLFDRAFAAPVYKRIKKSDLDRLPGDQDWIEECMPGIDTFPHGLAQLYREFHPDLDSASLAQTDARIVTFPTVPKPHQIGRGWVEDHWR